eukprot:scaffold35915_cov90-Isochrysis_galbana.AAC.1
MPRSLVRRPSKPTRKESLGPETLTTSQGGIWGRKPSGPPSLRAVEVYTGRNSGTLLFSHLARNSEARLCCGRGR